MSESPAPRLLLGLDIGTQAIKGIVVDVEGQPLARAGLEREPCHPRPGWVEMDAERDWWQCSLVIIRHLLQDSGLNAQDIAAIGICGLVPCLCPLDKEGHPLRAAILYADNRALEEQAWVNQQAGLALNAQAVLPKLVWIQRHEPQVFARTRIILSAHNYVVQRLTGQPSIDYDTASIMGGVFDDQEKDWIEPVCRQVGVPAGLFPPPFPATAIVGRITRGAAQDSGLAAGTPVIAGSGDTFPTVVGCGAVVPGDAMISFGTTGLLTVTGRPLADVAEGPHFGPGAITWGANVLSAGRMVRWFRDQFGGDLVTHEAGNAYAELDESATRVVPGSDRLIVLPHLLGRRTPTADAARRGAILGLTPSHTASHIYRAVLESFAYNIRQGFDPLRHQIRRVVATAGGAQSRLWRQIMADVLNTPVEYHPAGGGALGIAFLAGYAVGLLEDFDLIWNRWLCEPEILQPDLGAHATYNHAYASYCEFDQVLAEPFAHLAASDGLSPGQPDRF
jgi:xylulokinase